jgi:hypothetical protein
VHRELDRKGVTLMLLWQEYAAEHPHQLSLRARDATDARSCCDWNET